MLSEFEKHIETDFPELFQKPFLLACSGGLDSVVLAHLCEQVKLDFTLAHCNFNLRADESDADEAFVKNLAQRLNRKIEVTHFDTIGYVHKNKVSIEMAARELRYPWFAETMKERGLEILVTAHHADDDLETFIINLSRGTGIGGLNGIPPKTSLLVRPLLPFSRGEILTYAQQENFEWREDGTNQETIYLRNKIRHEIIPKLKELHPTFLKNFQMTQSYLSDSVAMLNDYVQVLKKKLFVGDAGLIRIEISEVLKLHPLRSYLHALFHDYGFRAWDDIERLLKSKSGKMVISKTHRLVKDREYLLLEEFVSSDEGRFLIQAHDTEVEKPLRLNISEVPFITESAPNILYVDKSTLKYPLMVRKWEKGDYFYPFGMLGKKKLSKYFKDEKVDIISKGKQWLLCSGNEIVWVIGRRSDQRFSVKKTTKNIIKFTLNI